MAGAHQPGPRDWANGVPEDAKIDGNFATVQAAVRAKAGLSNSGGNSPEPIPVQIKMKDGRVFFVHHEVALQKVHQGIATLV